MPPSQIDRDVNNTSQNANKSITPDSSNLINKQDKPKLVRTAKKPNPPYLSKACAIVSKQHLWLILYSLLFDNIYRHISA